MVRTIAASLTAALALAAASACGPLQKPADHRPEPTKTTSKATPAAPAYLADPKNGECHNLSLKDVSGVSDTKKPVPCSSDHTTLTVAVVAAPGGALHGNTDSRAYAVGQVCGDGFKQAVGGDSKTRAKSLYSLAWFLP